MNERVEVEVDVPYALGIPERSIANLARGSIANLARGHRRSRDAEGEAKAAKADDEPREEDGGMFLSFVSSHKSDVASSSFETSAEGQSEDEYAASEEEEEEEDPASAPEEGDDMLGLIVVGFSVVAADPDEVRGNLKDTSLGDIASMFVEAGLSKITEDTVTIIVFDESSTTGDKIRLVRDVTDKEVDESRDQAIEDNKLAVEENSGGDTEATEETMAKFKSRAKKAVKAQELADAAAESAAAAAKPFDEKAKAAKAELDDAESALLEAERREAELAEKLKNATLEAVDFSKIEAATAAAYALATKVDHGETSAYGLLERAKNTADAAEVSIKAVKQAKDEYEAAKNEESEMIAAAKVADAAAEDAKETAEKSPSDSNQRRADRTKVAAVEAHKAVEDATQKADVLAAAAKDVEQKAQTAIDEARKEKEVSDKAAEGEKGVAQSAAAMRDAAEQAGSSSMHSPPTPPHPTLYIQPPSYLIFFKPPSPLKNSSLPVTVRRKLTSVVTSRFSPLFNA